jgi:D-3-phosphoglycerate dehydrogenase
MKNILITTSSFDKENLAPIERLESGAYSVVTNPFGRKLSEEEILDLIQKFAPVAMIAGTEPLTRGVLEKAEHLKIISRCGIGLDSIDLETARQLGIEVENTPDAPTVPVAELTVGLILSLLRDIHGSDAGMRKKQWVRPMGNLLQGKTVGIIGCGRIGSCVAKLVGAFGCRILGNDPVTGRPECLSMVSLETLLSESDIVSLHLPYTEKTHHLLDANRLRSLKRGAFVVNTARGGLIDEEALLDCLQNGHLAGAAIDCFEREPYDGPLAQLGNVVLTGHIGSYAKEGRTMMEKQAVENLLHGLMRGGNPERVQDIHAKGEM